MPYSQEDFLVFAKVGRAKALEAGEAMATPSFRTSERPTPIFRRPRPALGNLNGLVGAKVGRTKALEASEKLRIKEERLARRNQVASLSKRDLRPARVRLAHAHKHTRTHTHTLSLSHILIHPLSLTHTLYFSLSHTHTH